MKYPEALGKIRPRSHTQPQGKYSNAMVTGTCKMNEGAGYYFGLF